MPARAREPHSGNGKSTQGASSGQEKTVNNLGLHSSVQCMQAQGSTFKMKNIRPVGNEKYSARGLFSGLIISIGAGLL